MATNFTTFSSPVGPLCAVACERGLRTLHLGGPEAATGATEAPDDPVLRRVRTQLAEYFDGVRREFELPLDPVGTEFQRLAWRALGRIPFGCTRSYAEQAAAIGCPTAVRAIGAANGRNPIAIVVPCHRVIGKDGSLTGYAGGLATKRALLEHEAAVLGRTAKT